MAITRIAQVDVGAGGAANITFSSIPSTYTDLMLVCMLRNDSPPGTPFSAANLVINSDTAANYSQKYLSGNGSTTSSSSNSTLTAVYPVRTTATAATASTFASSTIYIPNYTVATSKTISMDTVSENNAASAAQEIVAGAWSGTATINSLSLQNLSTYLFQIGSSATLYGISKSGATGATVA